VRLPIPGFVRRRLRPAWQRRHWESVWRSDEVPYWHVDEPRPALIAAVRDGWFPRDGTILEIGCGTGGNAAWLAREGCSVLATDLAVSAIDRARERHAGIPGLEFRVLDACVPDTLGRTFPAIVDSGCLHIVPRELHPAYRRNLLAWSAPGTRYFLRMGDDVYEPEAAEALARSLFEGDFAFEKIVLAPRTDRADERKRSIVFFLVRSGTDAASAG